MSHSREKDGEMARIWDAESGECGEVLIGAGDVRAVAPAGSGIRYRALIEDLESRIEDSDTGSAAALLPRPFEEIVPLARGLLWAGLSGRRLYIFKIEGRSSLPNNTKTRKGSLLGLCRQVAATLCKAACKVLQLHRKTT
jgi:hypothetical protein